MKMNVVEPSVEIIDMKPGPEILLKIEKIGRVCYKSENKTTPESAESFVAGLIKRGHESVLEHENISVKVVCDRGVSHEIVRHRIAAYSQSSTRYCNYSKDQFGNQITVVMPSFLRDSPDAYMAWYVTCKNCEDAYFQLLDFGLQPEQARDVLPTSLKTELVMTMNLREWRHFLKLRTGRAAHPQMREIANMILYEFKNCVSVIFDDIELTQ